MSLFLVDCEAPMGCVSPVVGNCTEIGVVLFDQEPFKQAFDWRAGEPIAPLREWVLAHSKGRPVMVSDNPAFDWQWVAAEFAKAGLENPFGHSARRIGDFLSLIHI
jgi:hypothetical protein